MSSNPFFHASNFLDSSFALSQYFLDYFFLLLLFLLLLLSLNRAFSTESHTVYSALPLPLPPRRGAAGPHHHAYTPPRRKEYENEKELKTTHKYFPSPASAWRKSKHKLEEKKATFTLRTTTSPQVSDPEYTHSTHTAPDTALGRFRRAACI